jgi:hypothetical protein
MNTLRHLKIVGAAMLVVTTIIGREALLSAAYFDCIGSTMQFWYYGSEVECNPGYLQNICEAGCDYCFHTGCQSPSFCTPGEDAGGDCNNAR